jgi:predicted alpha/beta hydrolase family esterase
MQLPTGWEIVTDKLKTAIIVHGRPDEDEFYDPAAASMSNAHWIPWLQKQLVMKDYLCDTPEMPRAFRPEYPLWKQIFERYAVDDQTVLVGHSCGAGFLLRWLSENRVAPKRVVLVAPFLDPFKDRYPEFFRFEIDKSLCARTDLHVFESDNDMEIIAETVQRVRAALPDIRYRLFPGAGHFCTRDLGGAAFPELAELALA